MQTVDYVLQFATFLMGFVTIIHLFSNRGEARVECYILKGVDYRENVEFSLVFVDGVCRSIVMPVGNYKVQYISKQSTGIYVGTTFKDAELIVQSDEDLVLIPTNEF